jgi:hypothetical protein
VSSTNTETNVRNILVKRIFGVSLALALALTLAACGSGHLKSGEARMPASSSDLTSGKYKDAVGDLKDAGFTNVSPRPLGDLIVGLLHHPGDVANVVIAGSKDEFEEGAVYKKNVTIVVEYHSDPAEPKPEPSATTPADTPPSAAPSPTTSVPSNETPSGLDVGTAYVACEQYGAKHYPYGFKTSLFDVTSRVFHDKIIVSGNAKITNQYGAAYNAIFTCPVTGTINHGVVGDGFSAAPQ